MSNSTKIEWTEATWNPVRGCSMATGSETGGCLNCYAARQAARNLPANRFSDGSPLAVMRDSGPRWTGRVELQEHMLDIPLRRKKPTTYFVNSMSDLFHEGLSDEAIDRVFAVMALCPQHTFQVLTKRAERMARWARDVSMERFGKDTPSRIHNHMIATGILAQLHYPLPNVWMGVSCEDQATADARIPLLLQAPAAVRFVSAEPLLGPIILPRCNGWADCLLSAVDGHSDKPLGGIDWVIVGGESGPEARPMHPDWARSIRDQCVAAHVPFFFKQWGEHRPVGCADWGSPDYDEIAVVTANVDRTLRVWPDGGVDDGNEEPEGRGAWFMEPVGKHAAGRLLDGRTWDEMPIRADGSTTPAALTPQKPKEGR